METWWNSFTRLHSRNIQYKHTTIGSMADLNAATIDDVRNFFKTYYVPNNATMVIAGDFDTASTIEM